MSEISAQLICSALGLGALLLYALYLPLVLLYKQYNSSFRDLPGPPSTSWLRGNFPEMQESVCRIVSILSLSRSDCVSRPKENTIFYKKWANEYGPTIQFKVFFNVSFTCEVRVLCQIFE